MGMLVSGECDAQADESEGRIEALAQAALDAVQSEECQNEPAPASSSPAPAFNQFARACAKRE